MSEATINIRVRTAELNLIDRAAEIEGKSRSAFLRDCAERAAKAVFPVAAGDTCPLCGRR